MRTKISTLSTAIALAAMSFLGMLNANTNSIQAGIGYRQDSFNTSISQPCGGSHIPKSKGHLHLHDVEIVFLGITGKSYFDCCWNSYVRANFDYGWVVNGKARESSTTKDVFFERMGSHDANFEKGHFSSVLLHNDLRRNSFVWDFDFGYVFFPFECSCEGLQIGPAIGFSLNRQHFRVKKHNSMEEFAFDFDNSEHSSSSCHKNKKSNRTSWWGPWFGFDFNYLTCNCGNLYGEVEFHFGRVRHDRRSNADHSFFEHRNRTKSFWGPSFKFGTNFAFCDSWFLDASVYYSKFFSVSGRRNSIKWATGNVRVDIGYVF